MRSLRWALIPSDWCHYNKKKFTHKKRHRKGKTMWGFSEKVAFCKPRRESSNGTKTADALVLDFQPLEL